MEAVEGNEVVMMEMVISRGDAAIDASVFQLAEVEIFSVMGQGWW